MKNKNIFSKARYCNICEIIGFLAPKLSIPIFVSAYGEN